MSAALPASCVPDETPNASSLSSRRGVAILLLLSIVQFMDVLDASILNIALPSIKDDLGFSQQSLQWVVNGYILTYGGFLLLGGRMADLLGRSSDARHRPGRVRRFLVDRAVWPTANRCSSPLGSPRASEPAMLAGRVVDADQHLPLDPGPQHRARRLGGRLWIGGAAGVLFGGLLTEGPGWRWVLFINVPFSAVAFVARLLPAQARADPRRAARELRRLGAFLVTGGVLLLVYTLVKAPDVGWGTDARSSGSPALQ